MADVLLFEVRDRVATLTLNRPDRSNAFDAAMIDAWAEALEECRRRDDIAAIVLTGAGKAFCSGGDVKEMQAARAGDAAAQKSKLWDHIHRIPLALQALDKPVIAAVNGAATGAGMDMALHCDVRFASEKARFAESYVKVGLVPGDGGAWLLPRIVGTAKALELLWTGDFVEAEEAARLGLVNKVLPADELLPFTRAFARRLADGPQWAIRTIKRAVYQGLGTDLRSHLDTISSHFAVAATGAEHREGVQAFLEKRAPRFNEPDGEG